MSVIDAWVAKAAKQKLVRDKVDIGPLGPEDVEVQVETCGLCHSDLSVLKDDWAMSQFPAILGHEAIGRVVDVGSAAKGLRVGQHVGVGWTASSCMPRPCPPSWGITVVSRVAFVVIGCGRFHCRRSSILRKLAPFCVEGLRSSIR